MPFADRLKELRKESGLSQTKLSVAAGLHEKAVRDIEQGRVKNPTFIVAEALAKALGVNCMAFSDNEPVEQETV